MEHLTKQQVVLLTLLVSFVTSMATGIVTVSLMDQAPATVTQTINRVVEKTIERVVADSSSKNSPAAIISIESQISNAATKVSKSLVRLKPVNGGPDSVTGLGIILSEDGLMLTDKAALGKDVVVVLSTGEQFPLQLVQSEILGDNAFAAILIPKTTKLSPVTSPSSPTSMKLGDTVFALSGKQTTTLEEGFIKQIPVNANDRLETSVPATSVVLGSPLFNTSGEVIGYKTSTTLTDSSFYPLSALKSITPILSR